MFSAVIFAPLVLFGPRPTAAQGYLGRLWWTKKGACTLRMSVTWRLFEHSRTAATSGPVAECSSTLAVLALGFERSEHKGGSLGEPLGLGVASATFKVTAPDGSNGSLR